MRNPFDKILNWYFTKNSLPYWSILMIDCLIVVCSGLLTYWIFNNAQLLFDLRDMMQTDLFESISLPSRPTGIVLHVAPKMPVLSIGFANELKME